MRPSLSPRMALTALSLAACARAPSHITWRPSFSLAPSGLTRRHTQRQPLPWTGWPSHASVSPAQYAAAVSTTAAPSDAGRNVEHAKPADTAAASSEHTASPSSSSPLFSYADRDLDVNAPLPSLKYPVVLVHGYLGYASLVRAPWPWSGPMLEYFGSVRTHLGEASNDGITVLTPVNPPAASIASRAKKLRWALGLQSAPEEAAAGAQGKQVHEHALSGSAEHSERRVAREEEAESPEDAAAVGQNPAHVEFQNTGGRFDASKHKSDSAPPSQHRAEEEAAGRNGSSASEDAAPGGVERSPKPPRAAPASGTSIILGGQQIDLEKYQGKFHLIAHSMGGLDCRYLIATLHAQGVKEEGLPESAPGLAARRIASLTTVATPHRGSPVADRILTVIDVPLAFQPDPEVLKAAWTFNKFSQWVGGLFGIDVTGITNLSTEAMRGFNERVRDAPGVSYFSYGGAKKFHPWSVWWLPSRWVRQYEQQHDPLPDADSSSPSAPGANDGLVSVRSAMWGEYLGTTSLDHLEQIGLGVWNKHLPLYRQMVFRLKELEEQEERREKDKGSNRTEEGANSKQPLGQRQGQGRQPSGPSGSSRS